MIRRVIGAKAPSSGLSRRDGCVHPPAHLVWGSRLSAGLQDGYKLFQLRFHGCGVARVHR